MIKDVDLRIGKNRLTAVVGLVGCGKSTLIKAILGEVEAGPNSRLTLDGSVAYVGQDLGFYLTLSKIMSPYFTPLISIESGSAS